MNVNLTSPADTATSSEPAGRPIPQDPAAALFAAEVALLTGLSVRTLEALRLKGGGPVYLSLSRRAVRYLRRDVTAWIEACRRRSTSDPGGQAEAADARDGASAAERSGRQ